MKGDHLSALRKVDDLYRNVVESPHGWTDGALEEWGRDAFGEGPPPRRDIAREVRRSLRLARKLRDFWAEPPSGVPSDSGDWRTRVDVALGIRAWRPTLALARAGLEEDPSEEIYEEVKARFRIVHGGRWMEGVSFDEWVEAEEG